MKVSVPPAADRRPRGVRRSYLLIVLSAIALCALLVAQASAIGGKKKDSPPGDASNDPFAKGVEAVKAGEYEQARGYFEQANKAKKDDPDILNMLAYTQRKTGQLDAALENYERALEKRPDFPRAQEYMGEAYLQAAIQKLDALKKAGEAGDPYAKQLVFALQQAAAMYPAVSVDEAKDAATATKW